MSDCIHENIETEVPQSKRIGNSIFEYKASVCKDCNAVLWDDRLQREYARWMKDNKLSPVQFTVTCEVKDGIEEILKKYPNASESDLVRAVLSLMTGHVLLDKELSIAFFEFKDSRVVKALISGENKKRLSVRLKPVLFEVVETWAAILGESTTKFIEDSVSKMVCLFLSRDQSELWNKELDKQFDLVLKAA